MKIFQKVSFIVPALVLVLSLTGPMATFAAGPAGIDLGAADNFSILTKTGISTTGSTHIVGDIGVSPAQATYLTGFALSLPVASTFATSPLVVGNVYAPGYANPTPATMTTAVSAMETAYADGAQRTNPGFTELGAGNIGGLTLAPGLYKWGTGVSIPSNVTLSGSTNDVWIFQIAQTLNVSSGAKILLSGGAQASNVYWIVAGQTTIGTTAVFNGTILDKTAIVLNTGSTLNGRALAQTAVTLDAASVTKPSASAAVVTPEPVLVQVPPSVPAPTPAPTPAFISAPAPTSSGTQGIGSVVVTLPPVIRAPLLLLNTPTLTSTPAPAASFGLQVKAIATNLVPGNKSSKVITLQQFLISQNKGPAARALAKVGTTSYFGGLTRLALAEFQASAGIRPALGNFGSITRAYLSTHF